MNKNVAIATGIGIIVIVGVLVFQVNDSTHTVSSPEE